MSVLQSHRTYLTLNGFLSVILSPQDQKLSYKEGWIFFFLSFLDEKDVGLYGLYFVT